jgi:heme-degrading monooxygenase HmoA
MIAVIFESWPNDGRVKEYLDVAASLRQELNTIEGFISIDRFESLTEPGKILSLSFWRDEKAIENWRRIESHREAQSRGRAGIFKDYRLRIAGVIRDYGMFDRGQAPSLEGIRVAQDLFVRLKSLSDNLFPALCHYCSGLRRRSCELAKSLIGSNELIDYWIC